MLSEDEVVYVVSVRVTVFLLLFTTDFYSSQEQSAHVDGSSLQQEIQTGQAVQEIELG